MVRATEVLKEALGGIASSRILQLESTRIARIWASGGHNDVGSRFDAMRRQCDSTGKGAIGVPYDSIEVAATFSPTFLESCNKLLAGWKDGLLADCTANCTDHDSTLIS